MKVLRNQDGIALITALMFTLICLGMIMTLLYYVLAGTKMSAAQKRYRSALEASYGGTEFITQTIIPRLFSSPLLTDYLDKRASLITDFGTNLNLAFTSDALTPNAFYTKLTTSTSAWPSALSKTVNPKDMPDLTFTLQGQNAGSKYKVYTKIVDTVAGVGLLDASGIDYLDGGLGVAGTSSSTQTPRTPNIYSIEVQGEAAVNPVEKAGLSVLYAY
ncbi:MAG: pilus assembly protein PilX [Desulfuromonadaceae bacterium]|nr:pilus assembly protein PilX [Desulfuromonadaceae bacterium]